jgi:hypothetical protein
MSAKNEVLFFGCWGEIGHYLHNEDGRTVWHPETIGLPWTKIDGNLPPGHRDPRSYGDVSTDEQVEGWAALHHKDGWTALAWWDRSVDKRHGSNAAIFVKSGYRLELAEMLAIGARVFPRVFARFTYTITTERSASR